MIDASNIEAPAWRETQNGWTITLAEGVSANIQTTRKGCRYNFMISGAAETVAEAQARLEELAAKVGAVMNL